MNRMQKRAAVLPEYGDTAGILDVCAAVHGVTLGAADGMAVKDLARARLFLQAVLLTWEEGLPGSRDYDAAVRLLVAATLAEMDTLTVGADSAA